jgi:hypothetical protein
MLISTPRAFSGQVKALLVNWLVWSLLEISGLPYFKVASSSASTQNKVLMLIDTRCDSTNLLAQSTMAHR